jgi:hypothetical protein
MGNSSIFQNDLALNTSRIEYMQIQTSDPYHPGVRSQEPISYKALIAS